jgi:hypothetical protein
MRRFLFTTAAIAGLQLFGVIIGYSLALLQVTF